MREIIKVPAANVAAAAGNETGKLIGIRGTVKMFWNERRRISGTLAERIEPANAMVVRNDRVTGSLVGKLIDKIGTKNDCNVETLILFSRIWRKKLSSVQVFLES